MRFDTAIYFQKTDAEGYDPSTGDYSEGKPVEDEVYASVTDTGKTTMNIVYGGIKQGSLTARIQGRYHKPFDFIRIGKRRYRVDSVRRLSKMEAYILSEVQ